MLFDIINNFPTYNNLSGYRIKGHCACHICEWNTHWIWLEHCKKNVFLKRRKFLHVNPHYRWCRKPFNGKSEEARVPMAQTSDQIFDKMNDMNNKFNKPFA